MGNRGMRLWLIAGAAVAILVSFFYLTQGPPTSPEVQQHIAQANEENEKKVDEWVALQEKRAKDPVYQKARRDAGEKEMLRIYGSKAVIDVVAHPDEVLLTRVKGDSYDMSLMRTAGPVKMPDETANAIAQSFSDPLLYAPPEAVPACIPEWAYKVAFKQGEQQVNHLYCGHCGHIAIDPTGQKGLNEIPSGTIIYAASGALEDAGKKYFP
jgi:hypothetical protein